MSPSKSIGLDDGERPTYSKALRSGTGGTLSLAPFDIRLPKTTQNDLAQLKFVSNQALYGDYVTGYQKLNKHIDKSAFLWVFY